MNLFNNKIIIFFIFLFISTSIFSQLDSSSILADLKKKKEITRLYKDSIVKIIDSLNKQIKRFEKPAYVPIKHWRFSGRFFFDGTQILLNNWVAGGQNNTSLVGKILVSIDYKTKLLTIDNDISLHFGIVKRGDIKKWWKNDDQQQFTTKIDRRLYHNLNYSALIDFKTGFAKGYYYPNDSSVVSDFLAPAYFVSALGIDYKPSTFFTLFIAPLSIKATIVNSTILADMGSFGLQPALYDEDKYMIKRAEKYRLETGAYLKLKFRKQIKGNLMFENNIELFSNFNQNPQNIDVIWIAGASFQLFKYLSFNLNAHLIYDDDIMVPVVRDGVKGFGPRIQYEQMIGLGLIWKFL